MANNKYDSWGVGVIRSIRMDHYGSLGKINDLYVEFNGRPIHAFSSNEVVLTNS